MKDDYLKLHTYPSKLHIALDYTHFKFTSYHRKKKIFDYLLNDSMRNIDYLKLPTYPSKSHIALENTLTSSSPRITVIYMKNYKANTGLLNTTILSP